MATSHDKRTARESFFQRWETYEAHRGMGPSNAVRGFFMTISPLSRSLLVAPMALINVIGGCGGITQTDLIATGGADHGVYSATGGADHGLYATGGRPIDVQDAGNPLDAGVCDPASIASCVYPCEGYISSSVDLVGCAIRLPTQPTDPSKLVVWS